LPAWEVIGLAVETGGEEMDFGGVDAREELTLSVLLGLILVSLRKATLNDKHVSFN
jgi:hypothetical protein